MHHMLSKAHHWNAAFGLWCYKNELGFSSYSSVPVFVLVPFRLIESSELQKPQEADESDQRKEKLGLIDPDEDDPFELFLTATEIRLVLLQGDPQDPRKHVWNVGTAGL